jgi:hypothetical protein
MLRNILRLSFLLIMFIIANKKDRGDRMRIDQGTKCLFGLSAAYDLNIIRESTAGGLTMITEERLELLERGLSAAKRRNKYLLIGLVVFAIFFGALPARSQEIDDPAARIREWFPDEQIDWLLSPPESIVLLLSEDATLMTTPSATPIVGDVLKLGPQVPLWLDTPESLAWEAAVEALGPRPFKNYEREALFEWDRQYRTLGPKPQMQDNRQAYDQWNLEFLRIMQKYGILNWPGAATGDDETTVDVLYPPFLEVLKLRLYEDFGYSVEGINVFKVQTPYGWYPEVYYLLKWAED